MCRSRVTCGPEYQRGRSSRSTQEEQPCASQSSSHCVIPPRSLMVEKSNMAPFIPYLLAGGMAFSIHPWLPICFIKAISLTTLFGKVLKCDLNDQKSNKDDYQDYKGKSYRTSVIPLNKKSFSSHSSEWNCSFPDDKNAFQSFPGHMEINMVPFEVSVRQQQSLHSLELLLSWII